MVKSIRAPELQKASPVFHPSELPEGRSGKQIPTSTTTIRHDLNDTGSRCCCNVARDYVASGHPPDTLVEFIRGDTPVFAAKPLSYWASRTVEESTDGRWMRLKRIKEAKR